MKTFTFVWVGNEKYASIPGPIRTAEWKAESSDEAFRAFREDHGLVFVIGWGEGSINWKMWEDWSI